VPELSHEVRCKFGTRLSEKDADPLKEMVFVVLLRTLLCLTAPPPAVGALFQQTVVQCARDVQRELAVTLDRFIHHS
jgi:hypothetical protein